MTRKLYAETEAVNDKNEFYEKEIELYKEQIHNLLVINENLIRNPSSYHQVIKNRLLFAVF